MPTINQLTSDDDISAGDLLPVWSTGNGDARKVSLSTLFAWIQDQLAVASNYLTQYFAPQATGWAVTVTPPGGPGTDTYLRITPGGAYAAGTVTLPPVADGVDGQRILVINIGFALTALTHSLNGATATIGAPTTLAANAFYTLRFDAVSKTWDRVN